MPSDNPDKMSEFLSHEGTDAHISNEIAQVVIDVMRARNGKDQWVDFSVRYGIAHELQRRLNVSLKDITEGEKLDDGN